MSEIKDSAILLWLVGLIAAINGATKPIPLIGKKAQEVFAGIGSVCLVLLWVG